VGCNNEKLVQILLLLTHVSSSIDTGGVDCNEKRGQNMSSPS